MLLFDARRVAFLAETTGSSSTVLGGRRGFGGESLVPTIFDIETK